MRRSGKHVRLWRRDQAVAIAVLSVLAVGAYFVM